MFSLRLSKKFILVWLWPELAAPISLNDQDTLPLPSNVFPLFPIVSVLAVANLVAVPALPDTEVCAGCTWSSLATLADTPTAAVPATKGVAVA